jgi:hypothetical protein
LKSKGQSHFFEFLHELIQNISWHPKFDCWWRRLTEVFQQSVSPVTFREQLRPFEGDKAWSDSNRLCEAFCYLRWDMSLCRRPQVMASE